MRIIRVEHLRRGFGHGDARATGAGEIAEARQDGFGRQQDRVVIELDLGPLFLEPGGGQFQRRGIGSEHGVGMAGVQRNGAARVEVFEAGVGEDVCAGSLWPVNEAISDSVKSITE